MMKRMMTRLMTFKSASTRTKTKDQEDLCQLRCLVTLTGKKMSKPELFKKVKILSKRL